MFLFGGVSNTRILDSFCNSMKPVSFHRFVPTSAQETHPSIAPRTRKHGVGLVVLQTFQQKLNSKNICLNQHQILQYDSLQLYIILIYRYAFGTIRPHHHFKKHFSTFGAQKKFVNLPRY